MTQEKQRIAIAEACGFSGEFSTRWILEVGMEGEDKYAYTATRNHLDEEVPDYPNDLNAMHEAEKVLTYQQWPDYWNWLFVASTRQSGTGKAEYKVAHATAAQRAEAFLRTIGKWEGEA